MPPRDYLGEFEQVVLLALARLDGPGHGMSIHEEILRTAGRDVSIPAVYVTLNRLEKKKLVSSHVANGTSPGSGRRRKYYELTPDGVSALARSRAVLDDLWRGVTLPDVPGGSSS